MKLKSFCIFIGFFVLQAQSEKVVVWLRCSGSACSPDKPAILSTGDTIELKCDGNKKCPRQPKDIDYLYFPDGSLLHTFPKDIFTHLPSLKHLVFENVGIRKFEKDDFIGAKRLKSLIMHGNSISEIPADVFPAAYMLKQISLSGNEIKTIADKAFFSLRLHSLHLDRNKLESLTPGMFSGVTVSGNIDLHGNSIHTIEKGTFASSAIGINLNDNQLQFLVEGSLPKRLLMLHLENNQLKQVMGALAELEELQTLDLNKNPMLEEQILSKLHVFPKLSNLNLNNANQTLPESIEPHHALKTLSLDYNNLSDSNALKTLSALKALENLNFDENKFTKLDHFKKIGNPNFFPKLKYLDGRSVTALESYCEDRNIECI